MSSLGNVWAANRIQHICNTVIHRFPISGLFRIHKRSQRDNIYNPKRFYGVSEKYITPRNSGSGVFLVCELWYYYNIMKNIILYRCLYDNGNHKEW